MEMKLNLKLTQKLVMTPMLQQAIKLLPLARMELAQVVRQEIVENPVLEELLDESSEESLDEKDESSDEVDNEKPLEEFSADSKIEESFDTPPDKETSSKTDEGDWDSFIQNHIDTGIPSPSDYAERPSIESTYKKEPSLADHLFWQLNLTVDSDLEKFIGSCIIGNIRSDGYLNIEVNEIAEICDVSEEEVLSVLKIVHEFDPVGVGARTLKECLLLQAEAMPERYPLVKQLIQSYLEKLEERNYHKIASELKVTVEEIISAIKRIREFSPKPGTSFSSEGIDYVTPDLVVTKTEKGYEISLNDEGIPRLRINPFYFDLLKSTNEAKTKEYLENKYRSAMWLIKSIDQRRQTIYKVGKSIVKLQEDFLNYGLSHLKPMVLKDVAEDIEMHESTVSRITTNKYIDTPQGIFELKFFFHSGIKSYMGTNLSSIRVKNMIKEVVENEDQRTPHTDDEMVQILMRKNAKIARRTVTKYRKEMNIPPASKRKKLF